MAALFTENVTVQIVIVIGSIVTTYLTVKYKDRILNAGNKPDAPKDRMEQIFDGYEKLIVQQQEDIERKTAIIAQLEGIVAKLRRDLDTTTNLLEDAREEVKQAKAQNNRMKKQLDEIRQGYNKSPVDKS